MSPLLLSESDVERLVGMPEALQAVEQAFVALSRGEADNVPRARAKAPGIVLHAMSAAAGYLGLVGWKQYTTTKQGARFLVGLHDQSTGELVALIEADRLGQLRTGAVTGIAARYLAPSETGTVGLLGSGWQAESQLAAVAAVLPLKHAYVYSRNPSRLADFCQRMSRQLDLPVTPSATAHDVARNRPLVITATSSTTPVLDASSLTAPTLVCAVGSNWPQKAEVDAEVIAKSAAVVCDDLECCRREAGDLLQAADQGLFRWENAIPLADVVSGRASVRAAEGRTVFFKSVGMAVEDVALAAVVLERARAQGVGKQVG